MRNISIHPSLKGKLPDIEDITDKLPRVRPWEDIEKPYRHKGHWDGKTFHSGFRNPEDIDTIVIHHSGSPEGSMESHARSHGRKWGTGIAYHLCIDKGRIWQVNNLLSFTYHVGNHNTYTIGIEVNRDLTKGDLTSLERDLLYGSILSVKAVLPIKYILGHNELNPTQCPATSMNRIRQDIAALEEQLVYEQSPSKQREEIFASVTRINDLYAKFVNKEGKYSEAIQREAERKLTLLYPSLKEKQFI